MLVSAANLKGFLFMIVRSGICMNFSIVGNVAPHCFVDPDKVNCDCVIPIPLFSSNSSHHCVRGQQRFWGVISWGLAQKSQKRSRI